ncbi:sigma-70 family RNA polymerase sigma factor [Flagellimonas algicola]|uniref:RNA polymerase sigma factor RpoD/SigA n=1 Tax=Flagellimonas algicola TaxID=2583815 RepID=A0ABY2WIY8_9FLAO|nr:RNA polymerase sigma factor RpoD/SigA [Allomuricauda algicola]TMU54502.1 RNA polymerase sigma factor RpoD/SigA [Allomuricauda algicola]
MRPLSIAKQVTDRGGESLRRYLVEVGRIPMITEDEEVELAIRIRNGDAIALEKLVNSNLRFVISVAKQYQGRGLKLHDLINEGNLGLVKAAAKFDETRGFKFISYAVWWVRQGILQAITENSRIVRLPLNKINVINRINEACSQFEQMHQRMPDAVEISEMIDVGIAEIKVCLKHSLRHISIDGSRNDREGENVLANRLSAGLLQSPEVSLIENSLKKDVCDFLGVLSLRESYVVRMYFGIGEEAPLVLDEIANNLEITKERVRQIKTTAIERLKRNANSNFLKDYLG